jgi:hypothetical protein
MLFNFNAFLQVPAAIVSRATESALHKNRKAIAAAASSVKKGEDSNGSATPSPEKTPLPVPLGKPKRVRPVSTGNSPAVSLVAEHADVILASPLVAVPPAPLCPPVSFSRPRAKKLLQGSLCFAVCAFDTTVPVPLRSTVSDYDSLLIAIHNQVRSVVESYSFQNIVLYVLYALCCSLQRFSSVFPGIQSAGPLTADFTHP